MDTARTTAIHPEGQAKDRQEASETPGPTVSVRITIGKAR